MDPLRTEEEQLEALKLWWEENGKQTVAAIVLVAAGWGGWQYWSAQEQAHREDGSALYSQLQTLVATPELTEVQKASIETLGERLQSEFDDTGYAEFAALELAKYRFSQGDTLGAEAVLLNINLTEARPEIAQVAGLRLARAQWANGDAETALATLNSVSVTTFTSLYDELRGDIAFSQADRMTARAYYQSALTALQNSDQGQASMQREGLLTMKIDSNLVDESAPIGETE